MDDGWRIPKSPHAKLNYYLLTERGISFSQGRGMARLAIYRNHLTFKTFMEGRLDGLTNLYQCRPPSRC
jgi:hypothetical protein